MRTDRQVTLRQLARMEDPFSDVESVVLLLIKETSESHYLEWKSHPPLGPNVSNWAKYRMVKSAIAFANFEGGFIVFGVDKRGKWTGVTRKELDHCDPAKIEELVNGCVFPEIPVLNYREFEHHGECYAVLHVPPSPQVPHVTVKQVQATQPSGTKSAVLKKYAVYSRFGAKSDLATPHRHQQIVSKRTKYLQAEYLKRIKEVPVPIPVPLRASGRSSGTTLRVARITSDPCAPAVRLTRSATETAGTFIHEEISEGIFDEINNLLDANALLAGNRQVFLLGEPLYYRIYAERQHVESSTDYLGLLTRTALREIYGPSIFWLLRLPPKSTASAILAEINDARVPQMNGLVRVVTLLGETALEWLHNRLERRWRRYPQKPDYYWALERIMNRTAVKDRRLLALRTTAQAAGPVLHSAKRIPIGDYLESQDLAAKQLTAACLGVFEGNKKLRTPCRALDVLAYGQELGEISDRITKELTALDRRLS